MKFIILLFTLLVMSAHAEPSKSQKEVCLGFSQMGGGVVQMRVDGTSAMKARMTVDKLPYGNQIWMKPHLLNIAEDAYNPAHPLYRLTPAKAEKVFYESCMDAASR